MKIEKGIEIPDRRGAPRKYPFPDMEIGDSFEAMIGPDALRAAAYKFQRKYGGKFTVRKHGEGARAWRVG